MRKRNTLNAATLEQVYTFICRHWQQFGYGPSMREIAESCFISRPNVYRYLDRLEMQGRIVRDAGTARSITVVRDDDTE
ncbi:MAG: winged helix-turn-helix transcriptional regulator [Anaerolineae bacterium]|nr:winged helix-turn-helix transcriptional regulator [Anaerolineae bacterium]